MKFFYSVAPFVVIPITYYLLKSVLCRVKGISGKSNDKLLLYSSVFGLIAPLVLQIIQSLYGARIPGHWFERDSYHGNFYVNLFPDSTTGINYRVPALIGAKIDDDGFRVYYIKEATLPDGKVLGFDDYPGESGLDLEWSVLIKDHNDQYWQVELTNGSAP
jgi:hypothetical protein